MSQLHLRLLGAFEATYGSRAVGAFPTDKVRALLAYLAMAADRPHSRHHLAALLWPELADDVALGNVRKSLHRLRETLDTASPALSETLLTITRQTVVLHSSHLQRDVATFEALLADSANHAHDGLAGCDSCVGRLAEAATIYRAELLEGLNLPDAGEFEEWLLFERGRLRELALVALGQLADAHLARREPEPASRYAARAIALDRWREAAYRQLMQALALEGHLAEATAQFEALRRLLAEEIGSEPEPETVALAERIRAATLGRRTIGSADSAESGAGAAGSTAGGAESAVAGAKGGTRGTATLAKGTDSPAAPKGSDGARLAVPALRLHNVPAQFTPFVGRKSELHQIDTLLADPTTRLVTLAGQGGVGKTRLSVEVARALASAAESSLIDLALAHRHPFDDIYFFSLANVVDADGLTSALASGMHFEFRERSEPGPQLVAFMAAKKLLLVLDNFEQIEGGEKLLQAILQEAPGVKLLVTSRRALNLRAERLVPLHGLAYPPTAAADHDDPHRAAVRLFMQLGSHQAPGLTFTSADETAIGHICRLVEGLPLAIELAASWLRHYDSATIAVEIERSLGFLATEMHGVADHHRSLEVVFRRSWDLLTPSAQDVLAASAVFQGEFSHEALVAVTAAESDDLQQLADHSLLRRTLGGGYDLHALVREFAAGRLEGRAGRESGGAPAESARQKHSRYYLHKLAVLGGMLYGPDPLPAQTELDSMFDNLRAAWSWAAHHDPTILESAAVSGLYGLLGWSGRFEEGAYLMGHAARGLAELTAAHRDLSAEGLLADCLAREADFLHEFGRTEDARQAAQAALAIAERLDDPRRIMDALIPLSRSLTRRGDYAASRELLERAIRLGPTADHPLGFFRALDNLATVHLRTDDPVRAEQLATEALPIAEAAGYLHGVTQALMMLTVCNTAQARFDQALAYSRRLLTMLRALGATERLAGALGNHGLACARHGDVEMAIKCLNEALELTEAAGYREGMARHLYNLAHVNSLHGQHAEALARYDRSATLLAAIGAHSFKVSVDIERAAELLALGHHREAGEIARVAAADMEIMGHRDHLLQVQLILAKVKAAEGDLPAAVAELEGLLGESRPSEEEAAIHYELWRLGDGNAHAAAAKALYRETYAKQPLYAYRLRLEELEKAGIAKAGISD